MLLQIIESIFWGAFGMCSLYTIYELSSFFFFMDRYRALRFVTVPAQLLFPNNTDDDDEYSDPELTRIYKEANVGLPESEKYKAVSIRYTLDLDEVRSFHEYTLDDHSKGTVKLNRTYVAFKNGTYVVLDYTFDQFDFLVSEYNNQRYKIA